MIPESDLSHRSARACRPLTVGWNSDLIANLLEPIEERTGARFSHLILTARQLRKSLRDPKRAAYYLLRPDLLAPMPTPDLALLASLEGPGVPTVHNMILADRYVARLPYDQALRYATFLACRLRESFEALRPTLVIGGYDGLHGSMAFAVARAMGLPWYVMVYTTIPVGMSSFAQGMTRDGIVQLTRPSHDALRDIAERTLAEYEGRGLVVPAYLSANSVRVVLARFPAHLAVLLSSLRRFLSGSFDPYTEYSPLHLAREWVRKRGNLLALSRQVLLVEPPAAPYVFFGLHLQPEASVDVWAPFCANQGAVVEALARAMPPTHRLLVKLHKSDADNYSRRELDRLRQLPGVELVSPSASSRAFIDRAALVVSIQGTMGLEAALLGKPVVMFGGTQFGELPSVSMVGALPDLPGLLRRKLAEPPPDREAILEGFARYLSAYSPGCYADWDVTRTSEEVDALVAQFRALCDHAAGQVAS